jgi:hypothetical protein
MLKKTLQVMFSLIAIALCCFVSTKRGFVGSLQCMRSASRLRGGLTCVTEVSVPNQVVDRPCSQVKCFKQVFGLQNPVWSCTPFAKSIYRGVNPLMVCGEIMESGANVCKLSPNLKQKVLYWIWCNHIPSQSCIATKLGLLVCPGGRVGNGSKSSIAMPSLSGVCNKTSELLAKRSVKDRIITVSKK